jgi:hypothetical protein
MNMKSKVLAMFCSQLKNNFEEGRVLSVILERMVSYTTISVLQKNLGSAGCWVEAICRA